jgi:hypothetical protein
VVGGTWNITGDASVTLRGNSQFLPSARVYLRSSRAPNLALEPRQGGTIGFQPGSVVDGPEDIFPTWFSSFRLSVSGYHQAAFAVTMDRARVYANSEFLGEGCTVRLSGDWTPAVGIHLTA